MSRGQHRCSIDVVSANRPCTTSHGTYDTSTDTDTDTDQESLIQPDAGVTFAAPA